MSEHQFKVGDRVHMKPDSLRSRARPKILAQIKDNLGTVVKVDEWGDPAVVWDTKPHHAPSFYRAHRLVTEDVITALARLADD